MTEKQRACSSIANTYAYGFVMIVKQSKYALDWPGMKNAPMGFLRARIAKIGKKTQNEARSHKKAKEVMSEKEFDIFMNHRVIPHTPV